MVDLNEIRRVYEMVDENGDGIVSVGEISGFINKLGIPISEEDLRCMVTNHLCKDQDCSISYNALQFHEFVHVYQSIFHNEDAEEEEEEKDESKDLMEAFNVFDQNKDGYISSIELQQVLYTIGLIPHGHDPQQCEKMICRFDADCNGLLDFSEFKNMMSSTSTSTSTLPS